MNESTTIFLVNEDVRCIRCAYELPFHNAPAKGAPANWAATQAAIGDLADWKNPANYSPDHLKMFKSFDPDVKVGDYVIVPTDTRWKFTVVRVIECDVDFDPETPEQMKWIVGKVDMFDHTQILEQESKIMEASRRALREKKRTELRADLIASHPEYLAGLKLVNVPLPPATSSAAYHEPQPAPPPPNATDDPAL